ncbi:MAG TPA: DUF58 domain-containing protein [Candidatus Dormibacteraeota bacterium]|nr:DUF58 domain-containing protein [Candidatus Dormibacteraeota bacterium]
MIRRASPRLRAYLVLGAAGLIAGAFLGRPEPVLLVAPLLIAATLALVVVRDPDVTIDVTLPTDRVLEGQDVELGVCLDAPRSVPWLELAVALPPGLAARGGQRVVGLQLEAGVERQLTFGLSARRWGVYPIDEVAIRVRDRFGFFAYERTVDPHLSLRVFPTPAALRRAIRPVETQVFAGDEVARRRGDGIEFADIRQYAPGDQIRSVNWRLSSRRPELHVNLLHPERSTDVVLLLDTFTDVPGTDEQSSLATAVRGANGIANHYLRRRDRVGLIAFGGSVRWLVPAMGLGQGYRIVEALLDARVAMSMVWMGVDVIPPRSLPPKALVIAITPLLDTRSIEALLDLRGRGFDLAIVELAPEAYIAAPADPFAATTRRLWRLQRELLRDRFRRLGVPVATWDPSEPLDVVLEEVRAFRRNARRASA